MDGTSSEVDDTEQMRRDTEWEEADREFESKKSAVGGPDSDEERNNIIRRMMKRAGK